MSEKTERRIVAVTAVVLVFCMVLFGVHQYVELRNMEAENYGTIE